MFIVVLLLCWHHNFGFIQAPRQNQLFGDWSLLPYSQLNKTALAGLGVTVSVLSGFSKAQIMYQYSSPALHPDVEDHSITGLIGEIIACFIPET